MAPGGSVVNYLNGALSPPSHSILLSSVVRTRRLPAYQNFLPAGDEREKVAEVVWQKYLRCPPIAKRLCHILKSGEARQLTTSSGYLQFAKALPMSAKPSASRLPDR